MDEDLDDVRQMLIPAPRKKEDPSVVCAALHDDQFNIDIFQSAIEFIFDGISTPLNQEIYLCTSTLLCYPSVDRYLFNFDMIRNLYKISLLFDAYIILSSRSKDFCEALINIEGVSFMIQYTKSYFDCQSLDFSNELYKIGANLMVSLDHELKLPLFNQISETINPCQLELPKSFFTFIYNASFFIPVINPDYLQLMTQFFEVHHSSVNNFYLFDIASVLITINLRFLPLLDFLVSNVYDFSHLHMENPPRYLVHFFRALSVVFVVYSGRDELRAYFELFQPQIICSIIDSMSSRITATLKEPLFRMFSTLISLSHIDFPPVNYWNLFFCCMEQWDFVTYPIKLSMTEFIITLLSCVPYATKSLTEQIMGTHFVDASLVQYFLSFLIQVFALAFDEVDLFTDGVVERSLAVLLHLFTPVSGIFGKFSEFEQLQSTSMKQQEENNEIAD